MITATSISSPRFREIPAQGHPPATAAVGAMDLVFVLVGILTGIGNAFSIRLVGVMPVSEMVLMAVACYAAVRMLLHGPVEMPLVTNRLFALFIACQAVAFGSYIFSDLYRASTTGDMMRGWARMAFLAIDLFSIAVLFGKSPRIFAAYLVGVILSVCSLAVIPPLFGDYWKFGFGFPATILVLLLAPRLGAVAGIAGILGIAAVHFFMDYRSLSMSCALVAFLGCVACLPRMMRRPVFAIAVVAAACGIFAVFGLMESSTSERHGRSNAERSAMMQAATEAFIASPLVGHGSWFSQTRVMDEFLQLRAEKARSAGVGGFDDTDSTNVAIHSQMLVSVAEGGLFGGTYFFVYGLGLLWAIYYATAVRGWDAMSPTFLFILVSSFFNLCMSPFSGAARVEIAVAAGLTLLLAREQKLARELAKQERNRA